MWPSPIRVIGVVAVLLIMPLTLVDWTAGLLWFRSLGYEDVFWRLRLAKLVMFAAAFGLVFTYALLNLHILGKLADLSSLLGNPVPVSSRRALPTQSEVMTAPPGAHLRTRLFILSSGVAAAVFGLVYYGDWDRLLRLVWSQDFGTFDPIYHRDVGFYLFALPALNLVQGGLELLTFAGLLLLAFAYYAAGAIQLSARSLAAANHKILAHLIANAGLLLAVCVWGFYLDRYDLLVQSSGAVFGAGYADIRVALPGLWVSMGAGLALIGVLAWTVARKARTLNLYAIGGYLLILIACLIVIPWGFQRFTVEPNELELETPFLGYNIAASRAAYGLDKIGVKFHPVEASLGPGQVQGNQATIENIRIWDDRPLSQTFRQLQQIRTYYSFSAVNVDRYAINGDYRQVMLSARELSADLPGKSGGWLNRHLQYTHGYGLAMCLAAEKDEQGGPVFTIKDLPPKGTPGLSVERPEIYYGLEATNYRIVPTGVREFDYPLGDQNVYTNYAGHGGVLLDSFWKKALFSVYEFDASIVLSAYLSPQSRIQFLRSVRERVTTLAPFLQYDRDPYLVIDQGRLYWIQDAYAVADGYPYAEPMEDGISYIRNSVKVVVDAYDGDTRFYVIDPTDPVLRVYRAAMPGLFLSIDEMPPGLRQHLRYPRDLFEIQVDKLNTYHMTVPQVFYNREDVWVPPKERYAGETVLMEPYYVLIRLPGENRLQFLLMTPVTPSNRDNMIAWIAARSDMPGYGEVIVYKLSKDSLVLGPLQIEAMIDQDTTISRQLTLWDQHGSQVIRGNLLVIPIEHSFLYVEPVFMLAEGMNIPQLKRVIVSNGARVAMGTSIADALQLLFGQRLSAAEETGGGPDTTTPGARAAFSRADQALRQGDWSAFGREWEQLKSLLEK
jgi:uncharacterized protein